MQPFKIEILNTKIVKISGNPKHIHLHVKKYKKLLNHIPNFWFPLAFLSHTYWMGDREFLRGQRMSYVYTV